MVRSRVASCTWPYSTYGWLGGSAYCERLVGGCLFARLALDVLLTRETVGVVPLALVVESESTGVEGDDRRCCGVPLAPCDDTTGVDGCDCAGDAGCERVLGAAL